MNTRDLNGVWRSRLKELMRMKGEMLGLGRALKPEELANEIGVSKQTVYNWLADDGLQSLTANHAIRLVRYFGVPINRIWELSEDTEGQPVAAATH